MSLRGKTLFITGASRGIGLAIGLRAARDGANVAIVAKTAEPTPKLEGTVFTAAAAIDAAGGKGLALVTDIRDENAVAAAVAKTVATFGGIDILVNNASAISLTNTESTPMKRYDLMHAINTRGTYVASQACIPHLKKAAQAHGQAHVLNISPPLNMETRWFAPHVAYTMAKFGMSMCVLGMAGEFARDGVAFNALWPRTAIATAAVKNLLGGDRAIRASRKPEIMADAAYSIFSKPSRDTTGHFYIDDEVLAAEGKTDLSEYAVDPTVALIPDYFI